MNGQPSEAKKETKAEMGVREHPFFGVTAKDDTKPVDDVMEELRGVSGWKKRKG